MSHIDANRQEYKRRVLAQIEAEKAYQNTKREDFKPIKYAMKLRTQFYS